MSINKCLISGNLTRNAELKATAAGNPVCSFGVAVNDRSKNQSGEWEDYPNFVDCRLFGRRAEAVAQYLTKGTKIAVEGKLHYSSWEDRNGGGRRSKLEVYVDELEFMSRGQGSQQGGYQAQGGYQQQTPQGGYEQPMQAGPYSDEPIPF